MTGLYSVDTFINDKSKRMFLVVMRNVFWNQQPSVTFDLKGSTYKRTSIKNGKQKSPVLKDLDWITSGIDINLGPERAQNFTATLQRDVEYLRSSGVMDYSLIIGITPVARASYNGESGISQKTALSEDSNRKVHTYDDTLPPLLSKARIIRMPDLNTLNYLGGDTDFNKPILSACGRYVYTTAIIDTLTPFGFKKRMEYIIKRIFQGKTVSCKPPDEYSARFLNFIEQYVR